MSFGMYFAAGAVNALNQRRQDRVDAEKEAAQRQWEMLKAWFPTYQQQKQQAMQARSKVESIGRILGGSPEAKQLAAEIVRYGKGDDLDFIRQVGDRLSSVRTASAGSVQQQTAQAMPQAASMQAPEATITGQPAAPQQAPQSQQMAPMEQAFNTNPQPQEKGFGRKMTELVVGVPDTATAQSGAVGEFARTTGMSEDEVRGMMNYDPYAAAGLTGGNDTGVDLLSMLTEPAGQKMLRDVMAKTSPFELMQAMRPGEQARARDLLGRWYDKQDPEAAKELFGLIQNSTELQLKLMSMRQAASSGGSGGGGLDPLPTAYFNAVDDMAARQFEGMIQRDPATGRIIGADSDRTFQLMQVASEEAQAIANAWYQKTGETMPPGTAVRKASVSLALRQLSERPTPEVYRNLQKSMPPEYMAEVDQIWAEQVGE